MTRVCAIALALSACAPAPEAIYTVTSEAIMLAAGTEVTRCWYAPLTSQADLAMTRVELVPLAGSHHVSVNYLPAGAPHPTAAGFAPCNDAAGVFIGAAQRGPTDHSLPEDTAVFLPAGAWIAIQAHFLNATGAPVSVGVSAIFHAVEPGRIRRWANATINAVEGTTILVPAHARHVVTARCDNDQPHALFFFWSHMHRLGTSFTIDAYDSAGAITQIYQSSDWEFPAQLERAESPLTLPAGGGIRWSCDYTNPGDRPVVGGGTAADEMCDMVTFHFGDTPEPTRVCIAPATT